MKKRWLLLLPVLLLGLAWYLGPWFKAGFLLLDAANLSGWAATVPKWTADQCRLEDTTLPTRNGPIAARLYIPGKIQGAVVLVHGLHAGGIAEARLGPFGRKLAARGFLVLTPEMEDLKHFRITARTVDTIEDSIQWLSGRRDYSRQGRVGVIGISFSGGLSVVAAARPPIRDRVSFVLSIGGHGDLYRTASYLCTGRWNGSAPYLKPHDYAVGVLLLNLCDRLVPPSQGAALADGISAFLREDYDLGRSIASRLAPPASDIMKWVDARDVDKVGPLMIRELQNFAADPRLSPERSPSPAAPVFLLHGADDRVIPPHETEALAKYLRGRTEVYSLITPLISHVQLDQKPRAGDVWNLLSFWAKIVKRS
ncbi:MAG TPA: alpha/beta hydrolase [Acidobacteriota bacterium]|jgi:dienelactone hydrolase